MGITDSVLRGRVAFELPEEAEEARDFIEWGHGFIFGDEERESLEERVEDGQWWVWFELSIEEEEFQRLQSNQPEKLATLKNEYGVN